MTSLADFLNRIRILFSIDRHELVEGGVIAGDDHHSWSAFRSDPVRWILKADDERLARLWTIVERRADTARPDNTERDEDTRPG